MNTATHEVLKFSAVSSPAGDKLVGTWAYIEFAGSYALQTGPSEGYLGSAPIDGTLTMALREFNLPTTRAPGDWPTLDPNGTVRY